MIKQHLLSAGPVIYPLLVLSLVSSALILERIIVLCRYPRLKIRQGLQCFRQGKTLLAHARYGLHAGLNVLQQYRELDKPLREELLQLWLQEQQRHLLANQRLLILLGTLAPLLGLLGTVLGIITMFQDISSQLSAVTPQLLANGMWQAMATTAFGLIIAMPALAVGQGGSLWARYLLQRIEQALNEGNLVLELAKGAPENHALLNTITKQQAHHNILAGQAA
jgi:biopolymer transport protein ExbB